MLVREGNKIYSVGSRERKDELFKGLIGKVNATKKDADALAAYLQKRFSKKEMDITTAKYGFTLNLYTTNKKKKNDSYAIRIGEKAKDKICVVLEKNGREVGEIKGLRLNNSKVGDAVSTLLKNAGVDASLDLVATSIVDADKYKRLIDKKNRELEAEKEQERKALANAKTDTSTKKDKTSFGRKDWLEVTPVGNAWIIDPGRI